MKETVLKYGVFSGLIMAVLLFIVIPITPTIGFDVANMILFFGEIVAFMPLYFGIRSYRQTIGGGVLTLWKGFNLGILMVVISCVLYAVSWIILYYWVAPDFPEKYFQYYLTQAKLHGALPKDLADIQTQYEESKKILANPFINGAKAFTSDQLEYGIIITLIFAVVLRKKPPTVEISNLN